MKVTIEGNLYTGSPVEIINQIALLHWDEPAQQPEWTVTYSRLVETYERITGIELPLVDGEPSTKIAALFRAMCKIGVLEIVEDE